MVPLINALNEQSYREETYWKTFFNSQLNRKDENHSSIFGITRICDIKMESRSFTGKNINHYLFFLPYAGRFHFKLPILRFPDIKK